jgi:predicted TIM-barrel fold metal-dependent hydrolase
MARDATRTYRLVSADGHLNEPGNLWTARCPRRFKSRAPRVERFEQGDGWVLEGVADPVPFGWGACAGRDRRELGLWARFEEIAAGGYDPKARVAEMDADRVDAEVIFPSGAPCQSITASPDVEFHHAMVRAYNDFLLEFCGHAPDRLWGAALLPSRGVPEALAEAQRVAAHPGLGGFLLKCYPHGTAEISEEDDALWAFIQETRKPLLIHVALGNDMPRVLKARTLPGTVHFYDAPRRMLEFIFSGVLDRFPDLSIVLTETDAGWLPYFAEQADDNYLRHSQSSLRDVQLRHLPSEYMARHFAASYVTDHYAIQNRHRIGVERLLWSSDYPHITSDWPYSWRTINASFAGVPADERHSILAGNALRIFGR